MDEGGRRWNGGRYCKTYMRRGLVKPRRKKQLAPTCCICIGKQTAAGSLWLARKMNKIMKKKGKFRVEMQKSNGGAERGEGAAGRPHCQLSDSRGMKRGGRTSIREGLCCAIFARRVQIVGEKIPRLLFLRRERIILVYVCIWPVVVGRKPDRA